MHDIRLLTIVNDDGTRRIYLVLSLDCAFVPKWNRSIGIAKTSVAKIDFKYDTFYM